jgi:hypothetical protein
MTTEKRCASIKDEDSRIEFARVEGSSGTHVAVHGYEDHDPERQRAYTYAPESEFLSALDELGYTVLHAGSVTDEFVDGQLDSPTTEVTIDVPMTAERALAVAASFMVLASQLAESEREEAELAEKIRDIEAILPASFNNPEERRALAEQLVLAGASVPGSGE